ncbi:MAG: NAD-dependent epimerase/dehydratase family protein [Lachnospiraceae bacterium]|nr:NAD-dependent epimerase/dehydratase family protein [Lachnospiraceae bacterium]
MYFQNELYVNDIQNISKLSLPWEKLHNTSVLITGATGMIGTFLVDVLMERNLKNGDGIRIYALGRSEERAKQRFGEYFDRDNFHFISCDINKGYPTGIHFDYLFHCASNTHPNAYVTDPVGTILTNVIGTKNVLDLAVESHARRVMFLSTVEVYGENKGTVERFRESDFGYIDCNTLRAGYSEGKRTGEALCQAYRKQYGLDVVIPRICRVYGPTMLASDSKALAQFIKKAVAGEDIVLKSQGTQYFSYCYVGDVVSGLLYILFYGQDGEAYNIADEKSDIHLRDLAGLLAECAGKKVVFDLPDAVEAQGFSKATLALLDSSKLKSLGWTAEAGIREQAEKTVKILKEGR